jgi:hypothetical protein
LSASPRSPATSEIGFSLAVRAISRSLAIGELGLYMGSSSSVRDPPRARSDNSSVCRLTTDLLI